MSRIRMLLVGTVAAGLLLLSVGVARADNLQQINSLSAVESDGEASYQLTASSANGQGGDGENGCNATPASPVTFTITTPDGVTAVPASLTFTSCQQQDPNNAQTVTFSGASLAGNYSATWVDSGPGGYNVNPATFSLDEVEPPVEEDDVDPVIVVPADITQEATGPNGASVSFNVTATDNEDPNPQIVCEPASGSTFALGTTQVNCTATDASGNSASASFNVTVQDTTPPAFSNLPADSSVYGWNGFFQPIDNGGVVNKAKAGQSIPVKFNLDGPANVNFTPPTAIDLVNGVRPVSCDWASGVSFPQGTTTVTCTASDLSGNTGSDSFTVTVNGGNLGTASCTRATRTSRSATCLRPTWSTASRSTQPRPRACTTTPWPSSTCTSGPRPRTGPARAGPSGSSSPTAASTPRCSTSRSSTGERRRVMDCPAPFPYVTWRTPHSPSSQGLQGLLLREARTSFAIGG